MASVVASTAIPANAQQHFALAANSLRLISEQINRGGHVPAKDVRKAMTACDDLSAELTAARSALRKLA